MLDEQVEAIRRAAEETVDEDGRTRARFIWAVLVDDRVDYEVMPSGGARGIGQYLNSERELGPYLLEKQHDLFRGFHYWYLVDPDDVEEDAGEMHRVECSGCEWDCESPFLDRLREHASEHANMADRHSVTAPAPVE